MKEYLDQTKVYLNEEERLTVVLELLHYAYILYDRVYVFKNFQAYSESFSKDPRPREYWEGLHYEKLIDHIKICTAFENYNKAILLYKGVVVHKVDPIKNKAFHKNQKNGIPVLIKDFLITNAFVKTSSENGLHLEGLNEKFTTISLSDTLKDGYQKLINLDPRFLNYLRNINEKRNRLHFYKNYTGAFEVRRHLDSINFAKTYGLNLIAGEYNRMQLLTESIP